MSFLRRGVVAPQPAHARSEPSNIASLRAGPAGRALAAAARAVRGCASPAPDRALTRKRRQPTTTPVTLRPCHPGSARSAPRPTAGGAPAGQPVPTVQHGKQPAAGGRWCRWPSTVPVRGSMCTQVACGSANTTRHTGRGLVGATAHGVRGPVVISAGSYAFRVCTSCTGASTRACGCGGQLLRGDGVVRGGGCVQQRGHAAGVPGLHHGVAAVRTQRSSRTLGVACASRFLNAGQGGPIGQLQGRRAWPRCAGAVHRCQTTSRGSSTSAR